MVDPKTLKLLVSLAHRLLKSKTFRIIAISVLLLLLFSPVFVIVAIAGVASTPTAIFQWGKNAADYNNGDKKTLNEFNTMQTAFHSAMDDEHQSLLNLIQQDITRNGYTQQGAPTASASADPDSPQPVNSKDLYKINDQYSDASLIAAADFAISAYSLKQGEAASSSGFQKAVQKGAGSYLTYTKTSVQNADGSRLFTYTVQFNAAAGNQVFGLSADDVQHVSQLSINLQLMVAQLEGKASNATITAGTINNGMGVSDSLIAFIEKWEGFVPNWYDDGYGTPTIGYGHIEALPAGFITPLTAETADMLLRTDLSSYIASVQTEFAGTDLKQNQIDALVSLCYNLGPNIWSKISLTNDIKNQASADVIQRDFEALDHVNGAESAGLLNRRMAEYQVFENDVYAY